MSLICYNGGGAQGKTPKEGDLRGPAKTERGQPERAVSILPKTRWR